MIVADASHSFKCLACKSPKLLQSLHSLQLHFAIEHGVVNLLSSPATLTVVPPAGFSCHVNSCNPDELCASCLFCGATGLLEEEMKEHLGSRHGVVFQQDWKRFCSQHCRWKLDSVHWIFMFAGACNIICAFAEIRSFSIQPSQREVMDLSVIVGCQRARSERC